MAIKQGNLPIELTSFVGRRSDVAEARRVLAESRVLTLTGLGGVGKTRLALRVAEDSRRVFPAGAWFVDLSELRDPALLDQTVLSALGIQDRSVRAPRSVLIDHIGDNRLLLVLDNCEHLVEWVAELVAELLRHCAGLAVLATSREALGVPGEIVMRVSPLGIDSGSLPASTSTESSDGDALALFEQRARAVVPDFRITDANHAAAQEIVSRLEGLPLAIELAAARLQVMSLDQLLRRLDDRFQLLTRGSRNAPDRHQALTWSIDWSYHLCTPQEQWLWAHLTVFAGSFDLEAAEGIFAGEAVYDEVVDLVTSLVDKSVLIREQDGPFVRYRMLETLRDYGRGLLADDEWTSLQRRHRDWYRGLVLQARADWIGPRQLDWMARLDRDMANVRNALEFSLTDPDSGGDALCVASALQDYWLPRGRFSEGRYWLGRALALAPPGAESSVGAAVVEAAATAAVLAALQRDIAAATGLAEEARRRAEELSDAGAQALANYATGFVAVADGDLVRGADYLERAIEAFRGDDDIVRLVPALYWFAFLVDALGDVDRAARIYEEALALSESRGEIMWRAMAMSDYGSALWRHGDHDRGIQLLEESLGLLRRLGNQFGCAWCFEELAWTLAERDAELASVLLGAADELFTATGSHLTTFASLVAYHDACVDAARKELGDRVFTELLNRGRAMTLDEAISFALEEQPRHEAPEAAADTALTPREWQVAELVAQGLTNRAIAERLVISRRTVDGHVGHIRDKLGFGSRTQIATWVLQQDEGAREASGP